MYVYFHPSLSQPAEKEKTHELEVELSDITALRVEAEHAKAGRASKYEDMIRVFVDNVRLLARVDKGYGHARDRGIGLDDKL